MYCNEYKYDVTRNIDIITVAPLNIYEFIKVAMFHFWTNC